MSESGNENQTPPPSEFFGVEPLAEESVEDHIANYRMHEEVRWMLADAELSKQAKELAAQGKLAPLSVEEVLRQIDDTLQGLRDRRDDLIRKNGAQHTTDVEAFREYNQWQGGVLTLAALLRAFRARNGDL